MASAVSALTSSTAGSAAAAAGAAVKSPAVPSEQMFLQLLVSQIKNQDPLNPTDSTQFVSQLAQFSELEQLIGIKGDLDKTQAGNTAATNPAPSGPALSATSPFQTPSSGTSTTTQG